MVATVRDWQRPCRCSGWRVRVHVTPPATHDSPWLASMITYADNIIIWCTMYLLCKRSKSCRCIFCYTNRPLLAILLSINLVFELILIFVYTIIPNIIYCKLFNSLHYGLTNILYSMPNEEFRIFFKHGYENIQNW